MLMSRSALKYQCICLSGQLHLFPWYKYTCPVTGVQIALHNDMMVRDVLNVSCVVGGHVSTLHSLAALYG